MTARITQPYRASPETLEQVTGVDFIAVIGASGVGKSTIIEAAIEADPTLHFVPTTTNRAPRPGEHGRPPKMSLQEGQRLARDLLANVHQLITP